jgi:hypothetical protein
MYACLFFVYGNLPTYQLKSTFGGKYLTKSPVSDKARLWSFDAQALAT